MPEASTTSASHALCVYAEPLVQGRRVLVVDDATRGVGACLLGLGARLVHVYDPNGHRARENAEGAPRGVMVQELPVGDFDVRDGVFDVAILPDVALVVEPAALIARVRRLLGPNGVAIVCGTNAQARFRLVNPTSSGTRASSAVDYYELFDLVALQFAHVRMIGLVPFVGVALAELGLQGEPEVTVDTQLAGDGDPPELFVALASQDGTRLAEYAIVQLPSKIVASRTEPQDNPRERVALAEAQLRASVLATQLEEAQTRSAAAQGAERDRSLLDLEASVAEIAAQLRDAETLAAENHARAGRFAQEIRQQGEELLVERHHRGRLEAELASLRQRPDAALAIERANALEVALRVAEAAIVALRERLAEVESQAAIGEEQMAALAFSLDEARSVEANPEELERVARLAQRTVDAEARARAMEEELSTIAEAHAGELVQLEATLRERGQTLKVLETELLRREHMVHELVGSLEEHATRTVDPKEAVDPAAGRELLLARAEVQSARRELESRTTASAGAAGQLDAMRAENVDLRAKLNALALEVARREGEITAKGWRVTELEELIAASGSSGGGKGAVDPTALARLQDELDALRQALTQEHEARTRAESGDELAKARAELARQATLIEQLSRELDGQDRLRVSRESSNPG